MRVLCGDSEPCPTRPNSGCCLVPAIRNQPSKGSYGGQNTNEKERARHRPPSTLVGTPEFSVNKNDASYVHYSQCVTNLPLPQTFSHHQIPTILNNLFQTRLSEFHPSFAVIVNLLVERYFPPDPDGVLSDGPPDISYDPTSTIDYIISSMSEIMSRVHAADRGLWTNQPAGKTLERLVLCCLAHQWRLECKRRRAAVWSPMPWSRASELERPEETILSESTFPVQSICEEDLPTENDSGVRFLQSTVGHPLDIPWFGAPHDGHPFCRTLSTYTISRRTGKAQTLFDDAALWVSALTFGVLEAATHTQIPEIVLVQQGSMETGGQMVLSGTRILLLLAYWRYHAMRDTASYSQTLQYAQATVTLLERALSALDEEIGIMTSVLAPGGLIQEVKLDIVGSVALTIISLTLVARDVWHAFPKVSSSLDQVIEKKRSFYPAMIGSCRERMYRAGWCPYTLSDRLLGILGQSSLFLSSIANLPPYLRRDRGEHRNCTRSSCAFYTISDTTAYVPRHTHPACTCEFSRPPLDSVVRLLSEGQIPVVTYHERELRIVPANGRPYVAISHVWADGMGSTTEDGLPTCMVTRVAHLAQTLLPESGAFWIDALCIPANGEMRKRAIKLMAQTYRDAAKVLVIDECVCKQCSLSKPWEENLLRIATSGWVRRVWTLQEGLLARELWVEFAEGPVDIEESLLGASNKGPAVPPGFEVPFTAGSGSPPPNPKSSEVPTRKLLPLVPLFGFRAKHRDFALNLSESSPEIPISTIVELLLDRTTTKAEDELPAISSLLPRQVDLDALLSIAGPDAAQRRMQAFLLQVRELSRGFALYPMPRLTLPRFAWAPRALATMAGTVHGEISHYGRGVCTKEGLLAEYFVAAFDKPVVVTDYHRLENKTEYDMFGMHVVHRTSAAASVSEPWVSMWIGSARAIPVTINALLFLNGNALNAGRHVWGAAVCGVWDDGSPTRRATENGNVEGRPRRLTYIAPCMVLNDTSVKRLLTFEDKESWPRIGPPSRSWVLLR